MEVDNSTFLSEAAYYTVSYNGDDGSVFNFIFATILDESDDSFLSDVEIEVLNYARSNDVELEKGFMEHVSVEKITDKKVIEELKELE